MAGVPEPDSVVPYPDYVEGEVSRGNVLTAKRGHRDGAQRGQDALLRDHRRTEGVSAASVSLTGMDVVTRVDDTITAEVIRNALRGRGGRGQHRGRAQLAQHVHPGGRRRRRRRCWTRTATWWRSRRRRASCTRASLRCSLPAVLEDDPSTRCVRATCTRSTIRIRGGIHANDILVFRPIFAEGRVGVLRRHADPRRRRRRHRRRGARRARHRHVRRGRPAASRRASTGRGCRRTRRPAHHRAQQPRRPTR